MDETSAKDKLHTLGKLLRHTNNFTVMSVEGCINAEELRSIRRSWKQHHHFTLYGGQFCWNTLRQRAIGKGYQKRKILMKKAVQEADKALTFLKTIQQER